MERKLKFTKANTAAVKGIAIIFLILYHGFSIKSRLYGYPVSFWPLSETTAMAICRVMFNVWEFLLFCQYMVLLCQ